MEKSGDIGKIDSVCQNCENILSKRPSRNAKCQHCGKFIFVRPRPLDRKRVLVTESEAEAIQNQWA
jgi:DNA-directed RNA polymerase subunit RPC12/RpoP